LMLDFYFQHPITTKVPGSKFKVSGELPPQPHAQIRHLNRDAMLWVLANPSGVLEAFKLAQARPDRPHT